MKVLILAGGYGTRISEETTLVPKPMIKIGNKPIIWHIMKIYSYYGFNDFIILCGYKGYLIKEYFANYYRHQSDLKVSLETGETNYFNSKTEPWDITLIDTGLDTMTGGRIKRAQKYVGKKPFMLTYGDGLCDVNISDLLKFHNSHKKTATITSSQPAGRFGALDIVNKNSVRSFIEKPEDGGNWINAGYFVFEPDIFDYIPEKDDVVFEQSPLENLAKDNELLTYKHHGFWKPMDTLKDKIDLNNLWDEKQANWKIWNE